MASNSQTSEISLGIQSAYDTAATAYHSARATVSGLNPEFDVRESRAEHPSAVARSTAIKTPEQRTSYKTLLEATFALYPNFIGVVLRGLGMDVVTTGAAPAYTHTFTIANDAAAKYLTVLHKMVGSTATLERKGKNILLNSLSLEVSVDDIIATIGGEGNDEGNALGTETKTPEVSVELTTPAGIYTPVILGTTFTGDVYDGHTFTIDNTLKEGRRRLWSAAYGAGARESFGVTGSLSGIDIDWGTAFDLYKLAVRGGLSGTAPSLTPPTGSMFFSYKSAANIPTAAVPYSLAATLPSVSWSIENFTSQNADLISANLAYRMVDNVATPLTIVVVNGIASYA